MADCAAMLTLGDIKNILNCSVDVVENLIRTKQFRVIDISAGTQRKKDAPKSKKHRPSYRVDPRSFNEWLKSREVRF